MGNYEMSCVCVCIGLIVAYLIQLLRYLPNFAQSVLTMETYLKNFDLILKNLMATIADCSKILTFSKT